jgi:hypothetical protein
MLIAAVCIQRTNFSINDPSKQINIKSIVIRDTKWSKDDTNRITDQAQFTKYRENMKEKINEKKEKKRKKRKTVSRGQKR